MLRAWMLVLLALPLAAAVPAGPVIVGTATQGSSTTYDTAPACGDALTPYLLVLRIVAGSPVDVLRLTAHGAGEDASDVATLAKPALIQYVSPDTCAHFTVDGLLVATVAVYEVTAAPVRG